MFAIVKAIFCILVLLISLILQITQNLAVVHKTNDCLLQMREIERLGTMTKVTDVAGDALVFNSRIEGDKLQPVGQIWPAICFCMGYELQTVFTFLMSEKKIKRIIIFCDL